MTVERIDERWEQRRDIWISAAEALSSQIEQWSREQNWSVHREARQIRERSAGVYELPALRVRTPSGELRLDPVALDIVGAEGRVDLEAWPSLNRVKLIRRAGDWTVMTDSNVRLFGPWNRELFLRLVDELLSVA